MRVTSFSRPQKPAAKVVGTLVGGGPLSGVTQLGPGHGGKLARSVTSSHVTRPFTIGPRAPADAATAGERAAANPSSSRNRPNSPSTVPGGRIERSDNSGTLAMALLPGA